MPSPSKIPSPSRPKDPYRAANAAAGSGGRWPRRSRRRRRGACGSRCACDGASAIPLHLPALRWYGPATARSARWGLKQPCSAEVRRPIWQEPGRLRVILHSAANLEPAKQGGGKSDPYVVLSAGSASHTTKKSWVRYRTLNPVWKQSIVRPAPPPPASLFPPSPTSPSPRLPRRPRLLAPASSPHPSSCRPTRPRRSSKASSRISSPRPPSSLRQGQGQGDDSYLGHAAIGLATWSTRLMPSNTTPFSSGTRPGLLVAAAHQPGCPVGGWYPAGRDDRGVLSIRIRRDTTANPPSTPPPRPPPRALSTRPPATPRPVSARCHLAGDSPADAASE